MPDDDDKPHNVVRFEFGEKDISWYKCGFIVGQDRKTGRVVIITDNVEPLRMYPPDEGPEG